MLLENSPLSSSTLSLLIKKSFVFPETFPESGPLCSETLYGAVWRQAPLRIAFTHPQEVGRMEVYTLLPVVFDKSGKKEYVFSFLQKKIEMFLFFIRIKRNYFGFISLPAGKSKKLHGSFLSLARPFPSRL